MASNNSEVLIEGWLRKRQQMSKKKWAERYFVLRGTNLTYYIRRGDIEPKGFVTLRENCTVSNISSSKSAVDKKQYFIFKVVLPGEDDTNEKDRQSRGGNASANVDRHTNQEYSSQDHDEINDDDDDDDDDASVSSHQQQQQQHQHQHSNPASPLPPTASTSHNNNNNNSSSKRESKTPLSATEKEAQKQNKKIKRKKNLIKTSKIVGVTAGAITIGALTAGIGLAAGLTFVGVSSALGGGGAVGAQIYSKNKKRGATSLIIGSEDLDEAKLWKQAIEASIAAAALENTTWARLFGSSNTVTRAMLSSQNQPPILQSEATSSASHNTTTDRSGKSRNSIFSSTNQNSRPSRWRLVQGGWSNIIGTGTGALRIFAEENSSVTIDENRPSPPMKAQIVLDSTPLNAFMCLMSSSRIDWAVSALFNYPQALFFVL